MKTFRLMLLAVVMLASCELPGGPSAHLSDVTVELDAFSGVPNPVFRLSAEEAAALSERLDATDHAADPSPPETTLGFRGFRITNPRGDGGIAPRLYIARGGLLLIEDAAGNARSDGRIVAEAERFLTDLAAERGYGEVVGR